MMVVTAFVELMSVQPGSNRRIVSQASGSAAETGAGGRREDEGEGGGRAHRLVSLSLSVRG